MNPPVHPDLTLRHIFVSEGHSYFGRHGLGSAPYEMREVREAECVAGHGLRGDRFFDHKENYKGQVTLFSRTIFQELCREMNMPALNPAVLRRNLIVHGIDLNGLIGRQFELQGIRLEGSEECKPCYWMDEAICPGAEAWLKGRGGLRCRILSDGWLRTTAS